MLSPSLYLRSLLSLTSPSSQKPLISLVLVLYMLSLISLRRRFYRNLCDQGMKFALPTTVAPPPGNFHTTTLQIGRIGSHRYHPRSQRATQAVVRGSTRLCFRNRGGISGAGLADRGLGKYTEEHADGRGYFGEFTHSLARCRGFESDSPVDLPLTPPRRPPPSHILLKNRTPPSCSSVKAESNSDTHAANTPLRRRRVGLRESVSMVVLLFPACFGQVGGLEGRRRNKASKGRLRWRRVLYMRHPSTVDLMVEAGF
ncbi:hypothetical protein Cgig2_031886 [Carnegiea gigantea]|uniref:Uncharacterized protein n=1 Tax=Carnegiea gigantea TaxID=171969 RepID=A0A9Q1KRP2_9CARY|nr:hypothetical protein Cgig2_031886 [Carnegiea gigantea]